MARAEEIVGRVYDNSVSMYWLEKILLILDYLQVYGILWNMSQTWPLPYVWLQWTRPAVWANVDYFSTTGDGALLGRSHANISKWGEMDGYLEYVIPFCVISALSVLSSICLMYSGSASVRFRELKDTLLQMLLSLMRFVYLPCALAVSRLYYCENGQLSADPNETCFSGWHLIYAAIAAVCILPMFVGLPLMLRHYVSLGIVYTSASDHEKRLQAWEIAHVFKLDPYWRRCQLWTVSSFTRAGAYAGLYSILFKAFCILVYILLRPNKMAQASVFWFGCVIVFIYTVGISPYRLESSNLIAYILAALLLVNASFGMCDAYGVQNSVMVAGTQALWLIVFNGCGAVLITTISVTCLVSRPLWPSQKALRLALASASWPAVVKWVEGIREGYAVDIDCYLCPPECVDILGLEEKIRVLRNCWAEACSVGSVFSLLLNDVIEQLLVTHTAFAKVALRRQVHWDKAWLKGGDEIFRRRHHMYRLMPAQKRRIILKLLALKAFIGDRVLRKCSEDEEVDEFGMAGDMRRRLTSMLLGEQTARAEESQRRRSMFSPRESAAAAKAREVRWVSGEAFVESSAIIAELGGRTEALLKACRDLENVTGADEELGLVVDSNVVSSDDVANLFEEWNVIVLSYERRELGGGSHFTDDAAEEWFTYRHLLAKKFEEMGLAQNNKSDTGDEDEGEGKGAEEEHSFFGHPEAASPGDDRGGEVGGEHTFHIV